MYTCRCSRAKHSFTLTFLHSYFKGFSLPNCVNEFPDMWPSTVLLNLIFTLTPNPFQHSNPIQCTLKYFNFHLINFCYRSALLNFSRVKTYSLRNWKKKKCQTYHYEFGKYIVFPQIRVYTEKSRNIRNGFFSRLRWITFFGRPRLRGARWLSAISDNTY